MHFLQIQRNMERIIEFPEQARDQIGTPEGAKSFLGGAQIFKLCPIVLNYCMSNTFFQLGEKLSRLGESPMCSSSYGPVPEMSCVLKPRVA